MNLRRESGRCYGSELATLFGAGILGGIEAVEGEEIDDLAIEHIIGRDNTLHLVLHFGSDRGEVDIEIDFGRRESV